MALCVVINGDGTLSSTGDAASSCPGYIMLSGAEYGIAGAIQDAFAMPDPTTAAEWFAGPFCIVVFLYLAARSAGAVANVFRS